MTLLPLARWRQCIFRGADADTARHRCRCFNAAARRDNPVADDDVVVDDVIKPNVLGYPEVETVDDDEDGDDDQPRDGGESARRRHLGDGRLMVTVRSTDNIATVQDDNCDRK